jgi:hypothetical protein
MLPLYGMGLEQIVTIIDSRLLLLQHDYNSIAYPYDDHIPTTTAILVSERGSSKFFSIPFTSYDAKAIKVPPVRRYLFGER